MTNKIVLSIAMTSVLTLGNGIVLAAAQEAAPVVKEVSSSNGGKCASGKCGTEKIFAKIELNSDPQDKLIRARDGKCGQSGQGINAPAIVAQSGKYTGGLCGQ